METVKISPSNIVMTHFFLDHIAVENQTLLYLVMSPLHTHSPFYGSK